MDQIEFNVRKQMEECSEAPFYVLGPLVTTLPQAMTTLRQQSGGAGWVVWQQCSAT